MGGLFSSPATPEIMIKRLENVVINRKKALAAEKGILKNRFSFKWTEREIVKKRTGISVEGLNIFLDEFLVNNNMVEDEIKVLRDLKTSNSIEDKVKTFVNDCVGGFSYGMIAATKSPEGNIDFILAFYIIKYSVNNALEFVNNSLFNDDYVKMKCLTALKNHGYIKSIQYE